MSLQERLFQEAVQSLQSSLGSDGSFEKVLSPIHGYTFQKPKDSSWLYNIGGRKAHVNFVLTTSENGGDLLKNVKQAARGIRSHITEQSKCPDGHMLRRFAADGDYFTCDRCDRDQRRGFILHGCKICEFDVCDICYAKKSELKDNVEDIVEEYKNRMEVEYRNAEQCQYCQGRVRNEESGRHLCNVKASFQCRSCRTRWSSGRAKWDQKSDRVVGRQFCRACGACGTVLNYTFHVNSQYTGRPKAPHRADLCELCIIHGDCTGALYQPAMIQQALDGLRLKDVTWTKTEDGLQAEVKWGEEVVTIFLVVYVHVEGMDMNQVKPLFKMTPKPKPKPQSRPNPQPKPKPQSPRNSKPNSTYKTNPQNTEPMSQRRPSQRNHKPQETKENVACDPCGRSFVDSFALQQHTEAKHMHARFECEVCAGEFSTRKGLDRHMEAKHSDDDFECEACGKEFTTENGLDDHFYAKHEFYFGCERCGREFSTENGLDNHFYAKHQDRYE